MPTWAVIVIVAWPPVAAAGAIAIARAIEVRNRRERPRGFNVGEARLAVAGDRRWS
jgi:hypothetical protein